MLASAAVSSASSARPKRRPSRRTTSPGGNGSTLDVRLNERGDGLPVWIDGVTLILVAGELVATIPYSMIAPVLHLFRGFQVGEPTAADTIFDAKHLCHRLDRF